MELVSAAAQQPGPGDGTDRIVPILIVGVMLVIAILIGYANFQKASPFRIEAFTSLPASPALDALQTQMARDGWQLGFRDADRLVMNIESNAGLGSTAALGCLSVWLALVHLVSARKTIVVEFETIPGADQTTIIVNGSRSGSYLDYVADQIRNLPKT